MKPTPKKPNNIITQVEVRGQLQPGSEFECLLPTIYYKLRIAQARGHLTERIGKRSKVTRLRVLGRWGSQTGS